MLQSLCSYEECDTMVNNFILKCLSKLIDSLEIINTVDIILLELVLLKYPNVEL